MTNYKLFHNSHDEFYRKPFGAVECGEEITLRIKIFGKDIPHAVELRTWVGNRGKKTFMKLLESKGEEKTYEVTLTVPEHPCRLWYHFVITDKHFRRMYYGNNSNSLGGIGQAYNCEPPSYQITVYKKGLETPSWLKESVMYQIFVDRFYNGKEDGKLLGPVKDHHIIRDWNQKVPLYKRDPATGKVTAYDVYGGNLLGVLKKLPYLKELGINIIYLNPIFEAPSNHKYDTGDYKKIDPMFGDNELFKRLCKEAKKHGIHIVLDGVFSHTGSDSIYFNKEGNYPSLGAFQSKESPYYPWYRFIEYPHKYECWWGIDTLPNVNELEPSYLNFIIHDEKSVLRYWMKMGAKGWRLDVADELPDEFIKMFRKTMKQIDTESVLIGEVWEDASNKVSYGKMREYFLGDELDSVTNYPLRKALIDFALGRKDAETLHLYLMKLYENYPIHHFYSTMNLIGSHDVPRILTVLGEAPLDHISKEEQANYRLSPQQKKLAVKRLKLLSLFQMTFPGVPLIYYGDEAGMEGHADPFNRGTYPWGRENTELLNWYKTITNIRRHYDVLKTGKWIPLYSKGDVYAFLRCITDGRDVFGQNKENNTAVVMFNRSTQCEYKITLNIGGFCNNSLTDLINREKTLLKDGSLKVVLKPLEGKLLIKNP